MKCFLSSSGDGGRADHDGAVARGLLSASASFSRLSLVRSFSMASVRGNRSLRRPSEFDLAGSNDRRTPPVSRFGYHDYMTHRFEEYTELRVFSFAELKEATRGFSRLLLIGEGGFGCVYRGALKLPSSPSVVEVAIKQLNRHGLQGHEEWVNEVNLQSVIKHPNLVKLIGYCGEDDERGIQRLLVYELMRNKSLEDHLFSSRLTLLRSISVSPLCWMTRLTIARDAARGLVYLHEQIDGFQLIFRDFKPANVLLDENFNAKLSDFGLAKLGSSGSVGFASTSVVGTVGYAAPEYVQTGRLTVKSDVWSFGVVLLELITGRRAVDKNLPRSEQNLLDWVKPYLSDLKRLPLVVDPRLGGQYCMNSVQRVASLAKKCLRKNPESRPRMSEVVELLRGIILSTFYSEIGVGEPASGLDTIKDARCLHDSERRIHKESSFKKIFHPRDRRAVRDKPNVKLCWRNGSL